MFAGFSAEIDTGEAVAVTGPSGRGKSSLLKLIYGSYRATGGAVRVWHEEDWVDVATAAPREVLAVRRRTIGYVTQFLRVIPRVPAEVIVAEPLLDRGIPQETALERARHLLARLNIPRTPLASLAHDLLGRRAAARQHRAGLCGSFPRVASRRTHGLARLGKQVARAGSDRGSPCCWERHHRCLS